MSTQHPARSPWAPPGNVSGELVARPTLCAGMTEPHRAEFVSAVVDLVALASAAGWDEALATLVVKAQGVRRRAVYAALYAAAYAPGRGDAVEDACHDLANLVSDPSPMLGTDEHAGVRCDATEARCPRCAELVRDREDEALDRILGLLGDHLALDVHVALSLADRLDAVAAELAVEPAITSAVLTSPALRRIK